MQAILTDLDGTLIHSKNANVAAYREAIKNYNLLYDDEILQCHAGVLSWEKMLSQVLPGVDKSQLEKIAILKRKIYPKFFNLIEVNEILLSFLQVVKPHLPIALVTSASRDSTLPLLKDKQLIELFDLIITAEDCALHKPDPQPYLKAAQILNVAIENCLILEDSSVGIQSGQLAGAQVWQVLPRKSGLF